ncbi:MAG: hypothetical protein AB1Z98_16200, partial [Nannocystaceae bacterium]
MSERLVVSHGRARASASLAISRKARSSKSTLCHAAWGSETITPDTTGLPADIQAFADAIYGFNNGEQRKVYEALQAEVIEPERT